MNKDKGITLVALVITIVVLIILAGVGISLSIGENGIFTKAKQAKENYSVAVNEETLMLANLEQRIDEEASSTGNDNNNGNNNEGIVTIDNGEYFFHSLNGFTNTLGTGKINSLFGLIPTTYESVSGETYNYCRYEKELNNAFDLSGEFEISFKNRLVTTSTTQMGGIGIVFQKSNNENSYDNVISIDMNDGWMGNSDMSTYVTYKETVLYNNKESVSQKYATIGIVGDGENVKVYYEDTLLATTTQENLSFDKIIINFYQYQGYTGVNKNNLERLYYGDIKYYKDII